MPSRLFPNDLMLPYGRLLPLHGSLAGGSSTLRRPLLWRQGRKSRNLAIRPAGRGQRLDRLVEAVGYPPGRFDAHRRHADEDREVRLKPLELLGADLPLPLITQSIEYGFTHSHDFEAERRDLKAFAAGVERIGTPGHVAAFLEYRHRLGRRLLGDRQTATQFGSIVGACRDGTHREVVNGAHIFVAALSELQDRLVHQDPKTSEEE